MSRASLVALLIVGLCALADAQQKPALGVVSFPTSGDPRAQADFLRGVAWLHSFGYEDAIEAFRAAQKIDPGFAMAYWGEALSFVQPLWFHEDVARGRAALAKLGATPAARASTVTTGRERGYLAAVEALFGPGEKTARDRAYADAMGRLTAAFPDDDEARTFYVLGLLALLPAGDAALPLREKAGAMAEQVFARNPRHPGAAHYILHAYDHGALAPKALGAARAYAAIAPAASHALHMPAHTFVQLGYWQDAAASDQASWDASVAWAARRSLPVAMRDFHSLSWLHYEWTQLGRFVKAREALGLVEQAMTALSGTGTTGMTGGSSAHHGGDSEIGRGSGPLALRNDRGSLRARYVIESERWSEMKGQGSFDNIDELFALGMSGVRLGDLPRAEAALDLLRKAPPQDAGVREQTSIMTLELQALLAMARGQPAAAFALMDQATALQAKTPKPIGRPYPVKGADELYGELLLQGGRAAAAVRWFERALTRTPNRSRAVLGLARATARAGDAAASRTAYQRLLANWKSADPNLPELVEARAAIK